MPTRLLAFRSMFGACLLALCAGCASIGSPSQPEPPTSGSAAEEAPEVVGTPASPTSSTPAEPATTPPVDKGEELVPAEEADEPEERDWRVDMEGRRYYTSPLPKSLPHRRLEGGMLRTVWGITVAVEREDDEFFYVRVYEVDPAAAGPSPELPTEEERAAIRARYAVEVPAVPGPSFEPFDDGLPQSGQWRNGFAIADIDGDGHQDIIHGPARKSMSRPNVFLGDGRGSWRRWDASFPNFPYDYGDAAVGDLDGDGRLDIVLGIHLRGLVALVQKEPGRFELYNRGLPFFRGGADVREFSTRAIEVLDWNGDGRLDIAALGEGPSLSLAGRGQPAAPPNGIEGRGLIVFLNRGDGSWEPAVVSAAETGVFGDHRRVADVDADGRPDLLGSSNVMGLSRLLARAASPADESLEPLPVRPLTYARVLAPADLDGDGDVDIAVGAHSFETREWMTGIDGYFQAEDGSWEVRPLWFEDGKRGIYALDAGDLDADGKVDLVGLTGDGAMIVLLGSGGGRFGRAQVQPTEPSRGCRGYSVAVADLDGDGRDEVVAEFAGEPTGLVGVVENPGCKDLGALRAWRLGPRPQGG